MSDDHLIETSDWHFNLNTLLTDCTEGLLIDGLACRDYKLFSEIIESIVSHLNDSRNDEIPL